MTRLDKISKRVDLWQMNRRPRRAAQLADDVPWLLDRIEHLEEELCMAQTPRPQSRHLQDR